MPCALHNGQNVDSTTTSLVGSKTRLYYYVCAGRLFQFLIFFQIPHTPQLSPHHASNYYFLEDFSCGCVHRYSRPSQCIL